MVPTRSKKMHHSFFVFIEISTAILSWYLVQCQKTEFIINKITECDIPGLKFVLENFTINYHQHSTNTYFNARFRILEDIKAWKKGNFHIERCNDQGLLCEHFLTINMERFCQATSWTNPYWYQAVRNMHPPFRCPIKKMTYEVKNAIFDVDGIINWYPEVFKYRWKTTGKIYNERDMVVACEIFDVHFRENKK